MAAVAERAGVGTGTAYVHYQSKDELVLATYLEQKRELGTAGAIGVDPTQAPPERFRQLWHGVYRHLAADPDRARFLIQFAASPHAPLGHEHSLRIPDDDLLRVAAAGDMAPLLVDVPPLVLYDLGIGLAVRLAAAPNHDMDPRTLDQVAGACWRAISKA